MKTFVGKVPTQNQLILSKTVQISEEIAVTCGFDAALQFKPSLIITQSSSIDRKEEVKFDISDWLSLSGLKNHIHIQLSTNHTESKTETFTIANIESAIFCMQYHKNFNTTLLIRQLGWEVELDGEEWTKIMETKNFIDGFFLWSEYARNTIYEFYTSTYIPACIKLNVWHLSDENYHTVLPKIKKTFYLRLCKDFEIMKCKIKKDINKAMIMKN